MEGSAGNWVQDSKVLPQRVAQNVFNSTSLNLWQHEWDVDD